VATYHREGLASSRLGRRKGGHLDRVEEAFQTLSDPAKKRTYDALVRPGRPDLEQRAHFRQSTRRLQIEDASEKEGLWDKIRSVVRPPRRRTGGDSGAEDGNGRRGEALPDDFHYFGEYLKRVREERKLSREEVAERCGIGSAQLEALEEENAPARPRGKKLTEGLTNYARCLGLGPQNGGEPSVSDRFDE
jgi:curved DNA-binding protein CbpA